MPASALERAFERGMNYFYWGSLRRSAFAQGLKNLASRRDRFYLVVQSYSPFGLFLQPSLESALRRLGFDFADVLLLGLWNRAVPPRVLDAAQRMKDRGLARFLAVSTHQRAQVAQQAAASSPIDIFHFRYNAVHTGAEQDIFPNLPVPEQRPGMVSYTATCWGRLMNPRRVPAGESVPSAADCYRFVLSNPHVDLCLTGVANEDQTSHALTALERGPMTEEELAWMRRVGAAIYGR
jgi:aryl-alcohol dehydrogenase-like predicted oxidoreductase